jgi:hypothetical protein
MKVKELIEELKKLDPELHVFTFGYEGGVNDVSISEEQEFILNYNTEWYYGTHEPLKLIKKDENLENKEKVKGIIL